MQMMTAFDRKPWSWSAWWSILQESFLAFVMSGGQAGASDRVVAAVGVVGAAA